MRLSDLDISTRRVLFLATIMAKYDRDDTLVKLREAVKQFEDEHAEEMLSNLLNAIFPSDTGLEDGA